MKENRPFGRSHILAAAISLAAIFTAANLNAQSDTLQPASLERSVSTLSANAPTVAGATIMKSSVVPAAPGTANPPLAAPTNETAVASVESAPPGSPAAPGQFPANMKPLVAGKTDQQAVHAEVAALFARLTPEQLRKFKTASSLFPTFCQGWGRKLHDREVDNVAHLHFQKHAGWETATYTGYGPVQSCECKESSEGIPIGKLTYQEYSYYVAGKTEDEAKHAQPKLLGSTQTLEIFSWDKNKWFY